MFSSSIDVTTIIRGIFRGPLHLGFPSEMKKFFVLILM